MDVELSAVASEKEGTLAAQRAERAIRSICPCLFSSRETWTSNSIVDANTVPNVAARINLRIFNTKNVILFQNDIIHLYRQYNKIIINYIVFPCRLNFNTKYTLLKVV